MLERDGRTARASGGETGQEGKQLDPCNCMTSRMFKEDSIQPLVPALTESMASVPRTTLHQFGSSVVLGRFCFSNETPTRRQTTIRSLEIGQVFAA